jgi:hypothetical protein
VSYRSSSSGVLGRGSTAHHAGLSSSVSLPDSPVGVLV